VSKVIDESYMKEALALAEQGAGRTRPNPMVGAVVVRNGRVVGRGFHEKVGTAHAECVALTEAGARAKGGTLYVTLEPCVHDGRTPPCVPKVLASGVRRVVVAHADPDPRMRGRGLKWLAREGVTVTRGVLEGDARALNAGYLSAHERGRPKVALKVASSLDGRIAPAKGGARWITGEASRRAAHALRARHDTIVVGAGTVRMDDPSLTVRGVKAPGGQPLRVIVSASLDLPAPAKLLGKKLARGTVVATVAPEELPVQKRRAHERKAAALARRGVAIWFFPRTRDGVALDVLLARLAREDRHDVLVEGGPTLGSRFADLDLVDELWLFVAPKLLGEGARPWGFGKRATSLADGWALEPALMLPVGEDLVVYGRPARGKGR
jgi:diaminohydroxyphosphoribosylaminopyrimidine deaminase/5-amino-6-(5-phosphoribosylamino)uracil reductase